MLLEANQGQYNYFDKIFPTIIAGVFGSIFVFLVNWMEKNRVETKRRQFSCNYVIFVLSQHVNDLLNLEKIIAKWRSQKDQTSFEVIAHTYDLPPIKIEEFAWIMETNFKNLLGEYISARNGLLLVNECIKLRNKLADESGSILETYLKTLDAPADGNLRINNDIIANALGYKKFKELSDCTNCLLATSQDVLFKNVDLIAECNRDFSKTWRRFNFLTIDPILEILTANGLCFDGSSILPQLVESSDQNEPDVITHRISED